MSQSYRADCNDAKAVRRGIAEPAPTRPRSKKDKPVVLEQRYAPNPKMPIFLKWGEWRRRGSYRTVAEAEKVIADQKRKMPGWYEFRIL